MRKHTMLYLVDRIETAESVMDTVRYMRVGDEEFHVLSKDADSVRQHHIRPATDMERSDMWRSAERGGFFALACALVFTLAMVIANPLAKAEWASFVFSVVVVAAFGAWLGGMVGARHSNFRFAPFYGAIEAGKYLIVIEVRDRDQVQVIKQAMFDRHPQAQLVGEELERHDPFLSNKRTPIHLRHM